MKIFKITILLAVLLLISITLVQSQDLYEVEDIEVMYATRFMASPEVKEDDIWSVTDLTGSANEDIEVLYGVVNLKLVDGGNVITEFIKVKGSLGSERFLPNSIRNAFYDNGNLMISSILFGGGGKALSDTAITESENKAVVLLRELNEDGSIKTLRLGFFNNPRDAEYGFYSDLISVNRYDVKLDTIAESGGRSAVGRL